MALSRVRALDASRPHFPWIARSDRSKAKLKLKGVLTADMECNALRGDVISLRMNSKEDEVLPLLSTPVTMWI